MVEEVLGRGWEFKPYQLLDSFKLGGAVVYYYQLCPRQVWFLGHAIEPPYEHELLELGRYIHEKYYKRYNMREVYLDETVKVDILDSRLVGEIKKSSKVLEAVKWQVLYYLYYLKRHKGLNLRGEILIPMEHKVIDVKLTETEERALKVMLDEIHQLINEELPPERVWTSLCVSCAYRAYCWSDEY